jgi:hypothetical protein
MNERIKELAEQAEIKFEAHPQHSGIVTAVITPADLEKFAELIVQECAQVLWNIDSGELHDEYVESLKKHFGIE